MKKRQKEIVESPPHAIKREADGTFKKGGVANPHGAGAVFKNKLKFADLISQDREFIYSIAKELLLDSPPHVRAALLKDLMHISDGKPGISVEIQTREQLAPVQMSKVELEAIITANMDKIKILDDDD